MDELELLDLLFSASPFNGIYSLTHTLEGYFFAGVSGWPDTVPAPSPGAIRDLEHRGWVRTTGGSGGAIEFELTGDGRQLAQKRASMSNRAAPAVDLAWPGPKPTLEKLTEAYEQQGAPEAGDQDPGGCRGAGESRCGCGTRP